MRGRSDRSAGDSNATRATSCACRGQRTPSNQERDPRLGPPVGSPGPGGQGLALTEQEGSKAGREVEVRLGAGTRAGLAEPVLRTTALDDRWKGDVSQVEALGLHCSTSTEPR